MPHLDKLAKANADKGLVLFAVNLRETPDKAEKFMNDNNLSLEVLYDDGKVAQQFGVSGIPHSVVIGRDGKIAAVVVGYSTGDQRLTKAVEAALAK
jgi:peroxiredoxin